MSENCFSFDPANVWPTATTVVAAIIGKSFAKSFSREDVEDIVSVVVTKMWAARESYDPSLGKLFTWAWKIAYRVIIDALDAKNRRRALFCDPKGPNGVFALPIPDYSKADDELIFDDIVELFYDKLKSARDKRILLYLLDGLDNKEIAEREGITASAAAMAVFHVRQKLLKDKWSA